MKDVFIDTFEVVRKFGYLIADKGRFSGLEFARKILASNQVTKSNKDCATHREACASSVASCVYEIELSSSSNGKCKIQELL